MLFCFVCRLHYFFFSLITIRIQRYVFDRTECNLYAVLFSLLETYFKSTSSLPTTMGNGLKHVTVAGCNDG